MIRDKAGRSRATRTRTWRRNTRPVNGPSGQTRFEVLGKGSQCDTGLRPDKQGLTKLICDTAVTNGCYAITGDGARLGEASRAAGAGVPLAGRCYRGLGRVFCPMQVHICHMHRRPDSSPSFNSS